MAAIVLAARRLASSLHYRPDTVLTAVRVRDVADTLAAATGIPLQAMADYVAEHVDEKLTDDLRMRMCIRLVVLGGCMAGRVPWPPWDPLQPQWLCCKVTDIRHVPGDHVRLILELTVFNGMLAGRQLPMQFTAKYVRWVMREIGAPRYEARPHTDIRGMVFWMLAVRGDRGALRPSRCTVTPTQKKQNRDKLNERTHDRHTQKRGPVLQPEQGHNTVVPPSGEGRAGAGRDAHNERQGAAACGAGRAAG